MAMDSEKFFSINDLYKRIEPALEAKLEELKREKICVTKKDIWNYCIEYKWKNKNDLRIYEIVDDILNLNSLKINNFSKKYTQK